MQRLRTIEAPGRGAFHVVGSRAVLFAALTMGATLVPASTAQATPPTPVEATLTLGPRTVTSRRFADDNLFLTQTTASTLSGDVDGSFIYEMRLVLHLPTGKGNFRLSGTFEGTVDGKGGAATIEAEATIDAGTQHCEWHMGQGTDALTGVHIQGQCEGPLGGPISLWGRMHFDP